MGRPQKDARLRKDADLRIPVTAEQKRLVTQAAMLDNLDMAAWVRPLLLEAAGARIQGASNKRKSSKKGKRNG